VLARIFRIINRAFSIDESFFCSATARWKSFICRDEYFVVHGRMKQQQQSFQLYQNLMDILEYQSEINGTYLTLASQPGESATRSQLEVEVSERSRRALPISSNNKLEL